MTSFIFALHRDMNQFRKGKWKHEENRKLIDEIVTKNINLTPECIYYLDMEGLMPSEIKAMSKIAGVYYNELSSSDKNNAARAANRLGMRLRGDLDMYHCLTTITYDEDEQEYTVNISSLKTYTYGSTSQKISIQDFNYGIDLLKKYAEIIRKCEQLPIIRGLVFDEPCDINALIMSDGSLVTQEIINADILHDRGIDDILARVSLPAIGEHDDNEYLNMIESKIESNELKVINFDGTEDAAALEMLAEAVDGSNRYVYKPRY